MPDYNVIQSLPYLDQVLQETLRHHAPLGTIIRSCTKDYVLQVNRDTYTRRNKKDHRPNFLNFQKFSLIFLFFLWIRLQTLQKIGLVLVKTQISLNSARKLSNSAQIKLWKGIFVKAIITLVEDGH